MQTTYQAGAVEQVFAMTNTDRTTIPWPSAVPAPVDGSSLKIKLDRNSLLLITFSVEIVSAAFQDGSVPYVVLSCSADNAECEPTSTGGVGITCAPATTNYDCRSFAWVTKVKAGPHVISINAEAINFNKNAILQFAQRSLVVQAAKI
jgi:hypothetical protein